MAVAPRVPPLRDDEFDDDARAIAAQGGPGAQVNLFRTLLWHPEVLKLYQPFGAKLRRGILPARDLELIILRIAWKCHAETEWGGHVGAARESGLSTEEIDRVAHGPVTGWPPSEAALLTAVDELHDSATISDATWAALSERYDRRQL